MVEVGDRVWFRWRGKGSSANEYLYGVVVRVTENRAYIRCSNGDVFSSSKEECCVEAKHAESQGPS